MRLADPMGSKPKHYYPDPATHQKPPTVMVSRTPVGWFLFLRHAELDTEVPAYGVDWDGWTGYHFSSSSTSGEELLQWGRMVQDSKSDGR